MSINVQVLSCGLLTLHALARNLSRGVSKTASKISDCRLTKMTAETLRPVIAVILKSWILKKQNPRFLHVSLSPPSRLFLNGLPPIITLVPICKTRTRGLNIPGHFS